MCLGTQLRDFLEVELSMTLTGPRRYGKTWCARHIHSGGQPLKERSPPGYLPVACRARAG